MGAYSTQLTTIQVGGVEDGGQLLVEHTAAQEQSLVLAGGHGMGGSPV